MLSMTGYGRSALSFDGIEVSAEIKTVNNRYLDANLKCPRAFAAEEENIRGIIREYITRGHADVYLSYTDKRERAKTFSIDTATAKAYAEAAAKIAALFPEAQNDVTVTGILRYPEVLRAEEDTSLDDDLKNAMIKAVRAALEKLNAMRKTEGEKLKADMLSRVDEIERLTEAVKQRAPLVAENYREKLKAKMDKILGAAGVDEARILSEAAIFADKSNIDEELTRLFSHISQFRAICGEEIVGRKLDFLVQEFNREANTICSKSNDLEITRLGLALKNEIEKVREQVQNVE